MSLKFECKAMLFPIFGIRKRKIKTDIVEYIVAYFYHHFLTEPKVAYFLLASYSLNSFNSSYVIWNKKEKYSNLCHQVINQEST